MGPSHRLCSLPGLPFTRGSHQRMSDQKTCNDPDDIGCNESGNTSFDTVLRGFLSRRNVLRGGVGTAATLLFTGGLAGCDDDDTQTAPPPAPPPQKTLSLNFNA